MIMLTGLNGLSAQTKRQFLQAADVAYAQKNYHAALTYYKTVADAWPNETNIQYLTAEAARAYNSYLLAEKHYQLVLDQDQGVVYPDAALHLAGIKQNLAKYDEAIKLYQLYDAQRTDKSQSCAAQIANCEFAKDAIDKKVDVELVNIGINTEFSEFAPVKIGDTLYFSSLNFPLESEDIDSKILLSRIYETGNDEISQLLRMQMVEGNRHIAHTAFDNDLDRMFYSICHNVNVTDYHCDLFYTEKTDIGWTPAKRLPDQINVTGYSSSQPAFARMADGREFLLYASDAPGGKGKMDIWMSELQSGGVFGQPLNMAVINTVESDITPFFHGPSQTMYFSSEGHMNLGGFDIYSIKSTEDGWGEIVHIPMPYNSSYNDMYFVTSDDGEYIYLASNRESGGAKYIDPELQACCNDIYRAIDKTPIMLIANGFNSVDRLPLPGTRLTLETMIDGEWTVVESKVDPLTHIQEFPLDRMHLYRIIGEKPGFLPDTLNFDTYDLTIKGPVTKDLFLTPEKLQLEVFTFDVEGRKPLYECSIRLLDVTDPNTPVLIKQLDNPTGNDFLFGIRPDRLYRLEAKRIGYVDTLATFDSYTIPQTGKIRQDMYLRRMELPDMTPVRVYFDNDIPGRRMFTKSTNISYDETFGPYLAREDEYVQNYMDDLPLAEKDILRERMTEFFKDSVSRGMRYLEIFCESLLTDLQAGNTVTVTLEGYCSPRAASRYNRMLGYRRAVSIRNYMMAYNDGVFESYVKEKKLVFQDISFGEERVRNGVSDNLTDERLSIYSVEAAVERRAEIIKVVVDKP